MLYIFLSLQSFRGIHNHEVVLALLLTGKLRATHAEMVLDLLRTLQHRQL